MKCPKCQSDLPKRAKFCLECGSNISGISGESTQENPDASLGDLRTMATPLGAQGEALSAAQLSVGGMKTLAGPGGEAQTASPSGVPLSDRYELMEEIGRGGFAKVWKARDKKLGRVVAVKRLLSDQLRGATGEQTLARFRREAQSIAQLNHRNIVAVYDHDRDAEGDYIVMECVEGGTLRTYLKQHGGKLEVSEAVALVRGIVQGLAYAHRKNLVHRDIKPANILLQSEGDEIIPKIVDFGLARVGSESELSMTGYGMGTPWYMPPEQRRDAKGVNHTADIYALGKTLYELVSGEMPDNVDPEKIPPVQGLSEVIFKSIKSNPEERYFSADDVLKALDTVGARSAKRGSHAVAGENPCPACSAPNAIDSKFCESCGAGMSRACPECERENSIHRQFCGGCGTDVEGFLKWQKALPVMEKQAEDHRWSRVTKEYGLLPKDPRLPGQKGRTLSQAVETLQAKATKSLFRMTQLEQEIEKTVAESGYATHKMDSLATALTEYVDLNPHSDARKTLLAEILEKIDERDWEADSQIGAQSRTSGNHLASIGAYSRYLRKHPDGAYAVKACTALEVAKVARVQQLTVEVQEHLKACRIDEAIAGVKEGLERCPGDSGLLKTMAEIEDRQEKAEQLKEWADYAISIDKYKRALRDLKAAEQLVGRADMDKLFDQAECGLRWKRRKRTAAEVFILIVLLFVGAYVRSKIVKENNERFVEVTRLAEQGQVDEALDLHGRIRSVPWLLVFRPRFPLDLKEERPVAREQAQNARRTTVMPDVAVNRRSLEGNVLDMAFVEVKAGGFEMGSNDGEGDEKPVHTVRITRDFWMGKTEVTQREYQQLMGSNPSHFIGEDLPVEKVSWNDAVKFCELLTERERKAGRLPQGMVYRLPTEAEWEYAARGGHLARETTYAGGNNIGTVAWYDANSDKKTQRVGTKAANELGIHDMSGNVWEWCHDWYQNSYNGLAATDPTGPSSGSGRVDRGGGWNGGATYCRVANRYDDTPAGSLSDLGFRVVLAAPVQ